MRTSAFADANAVTGGLEVGCRIDSRGGNSYNRSRETDFSLLFFRRLSESAFRRSAFQGTEDLVAVPEER